MATKTGELRETLIEAIHMLKDSRMDAEEGKSIAALAAQVNLSLKIELDLRAQEAEAAHQKDKLMALGAADLGESNVIDLHPEPNDGPAKIVEPVVEVPLITKGKTSKSYKPKV